MAYRIYNCKVFRNSSRQSKIVAAMQNSTNLELLVQTPEELDEEYRTQSNLNRDFENIDEIDEASPSTDTESDFGDDFESSSLRSSFSGGGGGSLPGDISFDDLMDAPSDDVDSDSADSEIDMNIDDNNSPGQEEVDLGESTRLSGAAITASQDLNIDIIKGSLNNSSDTAGVNRIICKDQELWIYYEDSINLNNIMSAVILYLNAVGYVNLEFNRLARSENAIVFQITCQDTNNMIHSIKDDENE